MQFAVGAAVVYGAHGVGHVVAREDRDVGGTSRQFVVVALSAGLTVSLPLDIAESQLRSLADEAELELVQQTLRQAALTGDKPWLARRRDMHEKLSSGGPLELAEIIRDTAPRHVSDKRARAERSAGSGEQDVLRKARWLLSTEIAEARGLELVEADRWIELQLASS
jgi:CarD family transcriptional regulator